MSFASNLRGDTAPVHLHICEHGLLVLWPDEWVASENRFAWRINDWFKFFEIVVRGDTDPRAALGNVMILLGQRTEETLDNLTNLVWDLNHSSARMRAGAQRRLLSETRLRLFTLQRLSAAHVDMLEHGAELAVMLPGERWALREARNSFRASATAASELYALLGEVFLHRTALIGERLTLATMIFLPLTVSTGFFGMNFKWLEDRIGSGLAFFVLGGLTPAALVLVTILGIRRIIRE